MGTNSVTASAINSDVPFSVAFPEPRQLTAQSAALATGHPLGAAAGLEILQLGGNAIDAAVAAMLAMCVVVPGSVGLGGYGGSAIVFDTQSGKTLAIDFDSRAPLGFREGLVTGEKESNYYGARAVTVPAVVAGLDLLLREFGTFSWREISTPAIRLATDGFEVDAEHQRHFDRCLPRFDRQSRVSLFGSEKPPAVGQLWKQPELARLLNNLAIDGPQSFYRGEIADCIVRYLADRDGILSTNDFASYEPAICDPIGADLVAANGRSMQFYTPPPPSGGLTSLSIMQTVMKFDPAARERFGARYLHVVAEAAKDCWKERDELLADPNFVSVPIDTLLSDASAERRAESIRNGGIRQGSALPPQSPHTANVVAADSAGNLISLTATQGWMYGSHLVVDGLGLVLNHGMSRFEYSPCHPNSPVAGKRMQHNMAPMIALDSGRPAYAFGLPGGPKIVSVTAQLGLDILAFACSPRDSIAAPRIHTMGTEPLQASQHLPVAVCDDLEKLGHRVRREADMGGPVGVLAIDQKNGKMNVACGEATGAVAGV